MKFGLIRKQNISRVALNLVQGSQGYNGTRRTVDLHAPSFLSIKCFVILMQISDPWQCSHWSTACWDLCKCSAHLAVSWQSLLLSRKSSTNIPDPFLLFLWKVWLSLLIKWHCSSISITWWYQTRSTRVKGESCSALFEEMLGTLAIWGKFPPLCPVLRRFQTGWSTSGNAVPGLYLKRETYRATTQWLRCKTEFVVFTTA